LLRNLASSLLKLKRGRKGRRRGIFVGLNGGEGILEG
jgi:hypothetical protein